MLTQWLCKCKECNSTGKTTTTIGMMECPCKKCKSRRKYAGYYTLAKKWCEHNITIIIPSIFFLIAFSYFLHSPSFKIFGILATLLGVIFVALNHMLAKANYNKSLFEERYKVFCVIETALYDAYSKEDTKGVPRELDAVYRRSYFLFSKSTYKFIAELRKAIIYYSTLHDSTDNSAASLKNKAREFIKEFLDGQNLAQKFPELKINSY